MLYCPVEDNHWTTQYLATRHKFSFQPVTGLTNNPLKKQQDNDGLILSFMISGSSSLVLYGQPDILEQ